MREAVSGEDLDILDNGSFRESIRFDGACGKMNYVRIFQNCENDQLSTYFGKGKRGDWLRLLNVRLNISAKSRVSSIC